MKDVANLRWAGFYVPVLSWSYLFFQTRTEIFLAFSVIVILGATIFHGILRSIFGPQGPEANPKKTWVVAGYLFALMLVKYPGGNPKSLDVFFDRAMSAISIYRLCRFVTLLSLVVGYVILTLYSIIPLYGVALEGVGDMIAGALLLSQVVFLVQGLAFNRFASVIPQNRQSGYGFPNFDGRKSRQPMNLNIEILLSYLLM